MHVSHKVGDEKKRSHASDSVEHILFDKHSTRPFTPFSWIRLYHLWGSWSPTLGHSFYHLEVLPQVWPIMNDEQIGQCCSRRGVKVFLDQIGIYHTLGLPVSRDSEGSLCYPLTNQKVCKQLDKTFKRDLSKCFAETGWSLRGKGLHKWKVHHLGLKQNSFFQINTKHEAKKNEQTLFMHIYCQYINLFQRLGLIFKYKTRFYFHKTLLNFPTAHFLTFLVI